MITGTIVIKLTQGDDPDALLDRESDHQDRRALYVLPECPDGSEVIVDIGSRRFVGEEIASLLHEHDSRLTIRITGTQPRAVAGLIRAARAGTWGLV